MSAKLQDQKPKPNLLIIILGTIICFSNCFIFKDVANGKYIVLVSAIAGCLGLAVVIVQLRKRRVS